jgi:hypothetical protein
MKTILKQNRPRGLTMVLGLLLGAASSITSQAAVNINNTVSFDANTNLYRYSYSITNTGTLDLILLTIPISQNANVIGISTPLGFSLTSDPVAQVNSFFEDNDIFTDNTFAQGINVSPFVFNSPLAPGTVTYTAFDVSGAELSGTTTSPVSPIPEPSTALLGGLAIVITFARRRR